LSRIGFICERGLQEKIVVLVPWGGGMKIGKREVVNSLKAAF
jgi:hypothetical protein